MKSLLVSLLALFAFVALAPATANAQAMDNDKNIVELAVSTPDLSTLVAAVQAAELAETLSGDGPFTVFAPTNAAFANLPAGVLDALLLPENKSTLIDILQYHVADGKVMAADIVRGIENADDGMYAATSMNGPFTTMMKGDGVAIKSAAGNVANVIATDVAASNGTVHLIDAVLLPAGINVPELLKTSTVGGMNRVGDDMESAINEMKGDAEDMKEDMKEGAKEMKRDVKMAANEMENDMDRKKNDMQRSMTTTTRSSMNRSSDLSANSYARAEGKTIVDVAAGNDNFKTLTAAVKAAGLDGVLASTGEFTVFAPTEDAFGALPEGTVEDLTRSENKAKLQGILQYHVIPARITAAKLTKAIEMGKGYARLQTIDGQSLYASTKNGEVILTDGNGNTAKVIMTDVDSSNGIVHAIDGVLMPRTE